MHHGTLYVRVYMLQGSGGVLINFQRVELDSELLSAVDEGLHGHALKGGYKFASFRCEVVERIRGGQLGGEQLLRIRDVVQDDLLPGRRESHTHGHRQRCLKQSPHCLQVVGAQSVVKRGVQPCEDPAGSQSRRAAELFRGFGQ